MGKVNELSMLVEELRKCGETLVGLSEGLAELFSGSAEEEKQPVKKSAAKKKAAEEPKPEIHRVNSPCRVRMLTAFANIS